jgi:glyoxylase-like metal-dependent hydrolase (beta-lactamase superfamily II)
VIRRREPIVVDTGCPIHRDQYLDDLFAIVEADDLHWVFLSHDDVDHDGNLHQVIDAGSARGSPSQVAIGPPISADA